MMTRERFLKRIRGFEYGDRIKVIYDTPEGKTRCEIFNYSGHTRRGRLDVYRTKMNRMKAGPLYEEERIAIPRENITDIERGHIKLL